VTAAACSIQAGATTGSLRAEPRRCDSAYLHVGFVTETTTAEMPVTRRPKYVVSSYIINVKIISKV